MSLTRPLTQKAKNELSERPDVCERAQEGNCAGRLTIEHAVTYQGRRIDDSWALVKLCTFHHAVDEYQDGGSLNKQINQLLAFNHTTDEVLDTYERADFVKRKKHLAKTYPEYA